MVLKLAGGQKHNSMLNVNGDFEFPIHTQRKLLTSGNTFTICNFIKIKIYFNVAFTACCSQVAKNVKLIQV